MSGPAWIYEALPKAGLYIAALIAIGVTVHRWLLLRFARSSLSSETLSELDRELARFGLLASGLALAALVGRVFAHTAAAFGAQEALQWDSLRLIAIESRWGHAWQFQLLTVIALMASTFAIRLNRRIGWIAYTTAALALCVVIPLLGHGATSGFNHVLHSLHLLGVSVWLGTLAVIALLHFRGQGNASGQTRNAAAIIFPAFSTIAMAAVALVALTGVVAAAIYLGSFSNLYASSYGRTLLIKIAGFFAILACGWSNWRQVRAGRPPQPRVLIAELAFAAAVILVTSVLTEMEHP